MFKESPLRSVKAALGCGTFIIFFAALLGIAFSFFAKDPVLAWTIRKRCFMGIIAGILMMIAWKIYGNHND
jgi:predicted tellurium resistance membrane protein TerC